MATSGNPAKRAEERKVENAYGYLILSVEIDKPDALDIVGYEHPYWPGETMMTRENHGDNVQVIDYVDGPITFHVTATKILRGAITSQGLQIDPRLQPMIRQLGNGLNADRALDEVARALSDELKDAVTTLVPAGTAQDAVLGRIDAIRASAVRGVRQA